MVERRTSDLPINFARGKKIHLHNNIHLYRSRARRMTPTQTILNGTCNGNEERGDRRQGYEHRFEIRSIASPTSKREFKAEELPSPKDSTTKQLPIRRPNVSDEQQSLERSRVLRLILALRLSGIVIEKLLQVSKRGALLGLSVPRLHHHVVHALGTFDHPARRTWHPVTLLQAL